MRSLTPTVRELLGGEIAEAARVVGRAMRDNPANVRAFGFEDAERRSRSLVRFFGPVLRGLYLRGVVLGALHEGRLVGVCGMAQPGLCQPTLRERLSILPSLVLGTSRGTTLRVLRWVRAWALRDPPEPHWHLGPVAVDSQLTGQGIGGAMLGAFCARMDQGRRLSYLETDKAENLHFYRTFGFKVIAEAEVLGVPSWFMSRPAPRVGGDSGP